VVLTKGTHDIKLVWVNAPKDYAGNSSASVQIGDVTLRNVCDTNKDGIVTQLDVSYAAGVKDRLDMLDFVKTNHIDTADADFVKNTFSDWLVKYDKNGNNNGKIERSEVTDPADLALFDKVNMSNAVNVCLKRNIADDGVFDQEDVDLVEKMVTSIYQTSRLQGADIASRNGTTLVYKPDGVVDEADIEAATNLLNSFVDVTGDGVVNDDDTQMITDLIDFNRYAVTPNEILKADINGDGLVNDADRELLEKISGYSILMISTATA